MTEDYYSLLNSTKNSTLEEIKRNYQQLIKIHHPDKQGPISNDTFLRIDEAWKTLRDQDLRRIYDSKIAQKDLNEHYLVYARLNISDLKFDDDSMCYYPCRCGSMYDIYKVDIENEVVIECNECSNVIVVNK